MARRATEGDSEGTKPSRSVRLKNRAEGAWAWGIAVADRGTEWIERQDPASRKGATVGWFRRFQSANGQLYAVLLTAYLFISLLPAAIVMATYIEKDPTAVAD